MDQYSKKFQLFYLVCCVIGVLATLYFNVQFVIEHGEFSVVTFVSENYVNNGSASIANDLIVVAVVFLVWSFREAKRLQMRNWWLYFALTWLVALAFAMPFFMLMRERRMAELTVSGAS